MFKNAVVFLSILWSVNSFSVEIESCSNAVLALEQGNIGQSKEYLRQYVLEDFRRDEQDDRCQEKFVKRLTQSLVKLLNGQYLSICKENLNRLNIKMFVQLDQIETRISALDSGLDTKARNCKSNIQKKYNGLFWLEKHSPELAGILNNCQQAREILSKPLSEIRLSQAISFIRAAELSLILVQENPPQAVMEKSLLETYRIQLAEAKQCSRETRAQIEYMVAQ